MSNELRLKVRTESGAIRVPLESTRSVRRVGLGETPSRLIATAVSELARTIVKHALHGEIRRRRVDRPSGAGVEIVATDRSPGSDDVEAALSDHYRTANTLGQPGVRRIMDDSVLQSTPGEVTTVTVTKWI